MPNKILLYWLLLLWLPTCFAIAPVTENSKQTIPIVSSGDMATWSFALLIVLAVFFLCVWAVRKLGGLNVSGTEKIRMIGGLSLGLREKVILLQVGKKQLLLGVTSGRIETLLVLEGEDCLSKEAPFTALSETGFAQKLVQAIKSRSDHDRTGS